MSNFASCMTKSDALLASIRNGQPLTFRDKLSLIVGLSIPSILAQITSVMMFFIDAAMVGHLGTEASASIGLIESTTWLMGSITNAASMGFSVQVAHYIGANDFERARDVFRNGIVATAIVSFTIALTGLSYTLTFLTGLAAEATSLPRPLPIFLSLPSPCPSSSCRVCVATCSSVRAT